MRTILNCELSAFADGPNSERQNLTAICVQRPLRIVARSDQCAAKVEHRGISARDDALGFAALRADQRGVNRRLLVINA
jgi:hypothetical protein